MTDGLRNTMRGMIWPPPKTVKNVVLRFGGLTMGLLTIWTIARRTGPKTPHDRSAAFFDKRALRAFGELSSGQPNTNGINTMGGRTQVVENLNIGPFARV